MQLHPIALTMRSCGTELLECIMMTLFKKWEPFSFFFSPCKEEQDLTKQSGWLPAKESWKTVHYPEGPVCFSQALWNLYSPGELAASAFWGDWLPFQWGITRTFLLHLSLLFLAYIFSKGVPYLSKTWFVQKYKSEVSSLNPNECYMNLVTDTPVAAPP